VVVVVELVVVLLPVVMEVMAAAVLAVLQELSIPVGVGVVEQPCHLPSLRARVGRES
jgi:hypothetical protein